jgi:hypothetical protein
MKFTREEVDAVQKWSDEVRAAIKEVLGDNLDSDLTTSEEDEHIAGEIFRSLHQLGYLDMPNGKVGPAMGGMVHGGIYAPGTR